MQPSGDVEDSEPLKLHYSDLKGSGLLHLQHPTDTGQLHCGHLHHNTHHLEPLFLKTNSAKLQVFPV